MKIPQLNPTGLQTSSTKTPEQGTIFDAHSFYERIARLAAQSEIENDLPVEYRTVSTKSECPFAIPYCEDCANGTKTPLSYGQTRITYNVSKCYGEFIYKRLLEKSRLKGIQLTQTFENAVIDRFNKKMYSDLRKWDYTTGHGIYIAAQKDNANPQGNGTGKSYALSALTHKLCRSGVGCLCTSTIDFFSEIKSTYDDFAKENEARVLSKYVNIPVLLWDDLGKESLKKNSDWAPEKIYYIVDERTTRHKPIVISSNFSIQELEPRFGEDNYGPAIVSRLIEHCGDNKFLLGGPDRRSK